MKSLRVRATWRSIWIVVCLKEENLPAVDISRSGTRREELLLTQKELQGVYAMRKNLSEGRPDRVTEIIINDLMRTKSNDEFIDMLMDHFMKIEKDGYFNDRDWLLGIQIE